MIHASTVLAWLVASAWVYKYVEAAFGYRKVVNLALAEVDAAPDLDASIVAIVPARDEAEGIAGCLESLLRQDCANLRVIAVDDRSTDETGAIMDRVAVQAGKKLQVLHINELSAGWLGKTHAMVLAAEMAIAEFGPEYLLFTDGDVMFDPAILRRALTQAIKSSADHFVVLPTTIAMGWGEAVVLSFLQVTSLWAIRPWRVADPRAKREAIGVGAFNLIRTDAYRKIGGFEAAPMEVLEDLYLGRRIKWSGLKQEVAIAPGMVRLHWASGARGIVTGMTKNIFAVFRFRPMLLLAAAVGMLLFCVGPALFAVFPVTRVAGIVAWMAAACIYILTGRVCRISPWCALGFPLAGTIVVYAMLRSMFATVRNRGIVWRGTSYSLVELRKGMVRRSGRSPHRPRLLG